MEKKRKVVLLPTDKEPIKGDILLRHVWKATNIECRSLWQYNETVIIQDVKQYTTLNGSFRDIYTSFIPQYLYILSDDEIKEGDYGYDFDQPRYFKSTKAEVLVINLIKPNVNKIIATTNPDLIKEGIDLIDDEFIKIYCRNENSKLIVRTKPVEETWDTIREEFSKNNTLYNGGINLLEWLMQNYEIPKKK